MSYIHPAALEGLRKRWERADAYRFAAPGTPEAKMPGYLHPWAEVARAEEAKAAAERVEQESLRADLEHLHRLVKDLKIDLALRRLRHKYSPDQPRVPAGNSDGGQWTDGGGEGAGKDGRQPVAAAEMTEFSAARKGVPAIVKEFGKWTARQYVSRYCEAKVNRELPGEFEDMTIADIWNIAKGGDARARTCMKLMQPRFKK